MKSVEKEFIFKEQASADSLLSPPVTGRAKLDYDVVNTPDQNVSKILDTMVTEDDRNKFMNSNEFYTLFLGMNVTMDDPATWKLKWARFIFDINGDNVGILLYSPNDQGIKAEIEKTGSREFNLSLSAEIGPPMSQGTKITPGVSYDKKNGWTVKYDNTIAEVKGFKSRGAGDKVNLEWDMYRDEAAEVPESSIGFTTSVYGTALVSNTNGAEKSNVGITIDGSTKRIQHARLRRNEGTIQKTFIDNFKVEPTI